MYALLMAHPLTTVRATPADPALGFPRPAQRAPHPRPLGGPPQRMRRVVRVTPQGPESTTTSRGNVESAAENLKWHGRFTIAWVDRGISEVYKHP